MLGPFNSRNRLSPPISLALPVAFIVVAAVSSTLFSYWASSLALPPPLPLFKCERLRAPPRQPGRQVQLELVLRVSLCFATAARGVRYLAGLKWLKESS